MNNGIIICIDDERVVLNGLQSQLVRDFGAEYAIELAESGEEALELVKELINEGNEILVVISDQLMPGIKGHELLKHIHLISPATFNVLLTGHSDLEAVTDAVNNANLYRYLTKPWEEKDLVLTVREAIKSFYQGQKLEIQNKLLERHNKELELLVSERTQELQEEKRKIDDLLLNILPNEIAAELKENGEATPRHYELATVLFTDFQSFTQLASTATPQELVHTLNECYTAFDEIIERHNLEKIKTIGDAYMCAGGLPNKNFTNPIDAVAAAWEIHKWVADWNNDRQIIGKIPWNIRIGIHTGTLIAGVIGKKKFCYDIWGDAVNMASRIESHGEIGKINISKATFDLVKHRYHCTHRGKIAAKGKGEIDMYFVERTI